MPIYNPPTFPNVRFIRKPADQTVNNSIVLVNDAHLFLPVLANEIWEVFFWLSINTSAVADIRVDFAIPAGGTIEVARGGLVGSLAAQSAIRSDATGADGGVVAIDGYGINAFLPFWCRYVGAAAGGNIQLRWAQQVAEVSNTRILMNSYIKTYPIV